MSNLKEQVNKTAEILNDIKSALEDQGVDTTGMTPKDYANAVRGVVNDITIENVGLMPILIFRYNAERPLTPTGGSWNSETNELFLPDGWYDDIDKQFDVAERQHPLWISSAIFSSTGELYKTWTTPVRISGKDGVNGKQGEPGLPGTVAGLTQFFNTPIFYRGDSTRPSTPIVSYDALENQLSLPSNWELTTVETEDGEVYWQSIVSYNTANNPPATATAPVRITAESSLVKGNIRWYQTNNSPTKPIKGTNLWKEWSEDYNIAPSASEPYLWCYDETIYSAENKTTSPVFLLCTYVKGLLDIDISYTVGSSQEVITKDDYPVNFWFVNSKDALDIHQDLPQHPDDSENKYYPGLNEKTMLLWCKETFNFLDHDESFYRIISYYKAAEKAPVLYSAGVFNTGVRYTRNEEQCPYIFYPAGLYLDKDEMAITVIDKDTGKERPAKDSDAPDGKKYQYFFLKNSYEIGAENNYKSFYDAYADKRWKKIDSFEAIYSDIGIFKSALVGKFVFDDKYMFSMRGKDMTPGSALYGKMNIDYTNYTDAKGSVYDLESNSIKERIGVASAIEDESATQRFVPSALINAITGESWFANGTTKFYYDGEGDLADGAIAWRYEKDSETDKKKDKPTLYISGDVKIGVSAPEHVYDESEGIEDTGVTLFDLTNKVTKVVEDAASLNARLDKKITNHFYPHEPGINNMPWINWASIDGEEENHIGDTFTNTSSSDYKTYIFAEEDEGIYTWTLLEEDKWSIYKNIANNTAASDGKITTYLDETDPSGSWIGDDNTHEGDLWFNNGTIKIWSCHNNTWGWDTCLDNTEFINSVNSEIGAIKEQTDRTVINHFVKWDSVTGSTAIEKATQYLKNISDKSTDDYTYDTISVISNKSSTNNTVVHYDVKSGTKINNKYELSEISDSKQKELLNQAASTYAAADGSIKTIISESEPNVNDYNKGDMWIDGNNILHIHNGTSWANDVTTKSVKTVESNLSTAVTNFGRQITILGTSIENIQHQIDGVVENYFYEGAPTFNPSKEPFKLWITGVPDSEIDVKIYNHVGDTYTNIASAESGDSTAGHSWRLCEQNDNNIDAEYITVTINNSKKRLHWHPIADSDAVKALQEAAKAQTTADGKARTFVTKPTPPYSEGDLWVQGSSGDIKRCKEGVKKEKLTDVFDENDWENASKYTDDTKANEAWNKADSAETLATNATTKLNAWTEDGTISRFELQGIKDEYSFAIADKADITNQATRYNVSSDAFKTACDNYTSDLKTIIDSFKTTPTPESVSIPDNLSTNQTTYYNNRTTILSSIAVAAKKIADDAMRSSSEASRPNLLANSAELVLAATGSNTYKVFGLPITVSTGDEFTFKAENIERLAGTINLVAVRILSPDLQKAYSDNTVGLGENKVLTFKITASGVSNAKAVFLLYAGTVNSTTGNTIRYTNFSLVKGSTAMSMWQDYQGDNGLKNLLTIDEEYHGAHNAHYYYMETLPITMSKGDTFTVNIDSLVLESGTTSSSFYRATLYALDVDGKDKASVVDIPMGKGGWGTLKVTSDITNQKVTFAIWKNDSTGNATAKITRMSLVRGTRPMMVWKGTDDITYLKKTFGTVSDNSGATLAKYIGVKDSNNKIIGALNGSDLGKDSTHGKLILAAGIDGIDNMSSATTRIYENGKLITNSADITGNITATGLKIDFSQLDSGFNGSIPTKGTKNWLYADDGYLYITLLYNGTFYKTKINHNQIFWEGEGLGTDPAFIDGYGYYTYKSVGDGSYAYLSAIDGLCVYGKDKRNSSSYKTSTKIGGGSINCYSVDASYINATTSMNSKGFYETSDARIKDFENKIEVDLDTIKNIPKTYFRWKDKPDKLEIGTSAQEVQKLYPEIVNEDSEGMLSVDYSKLSIIALAAIDKLHEENIELKNRLTKLEELYGNRN